MALIDAAVKEAHEVCEVRDGEGVSEGGSEGGSAPGNECAAAWDEAEELAAELERQKRKNRDIVE